MTAGFRTRDRMVAETDDRVGRRGDSLTNHGTAWQSFWLGVLSTTLAGCPGTNRPDDSAAEDAPTPEDGEMEGHRDDARPDVEAEGEGEPDGSLDVDADADGRDADSDDAGADEFDADSLLPVGCRFVRPTTDMLSGWTGRNSIDDGKLVWRWVDESSGTSVSVVMVRDLATGMDHEILRRIYPATVNAPAVHGGSVFFYGHPVEPDAPSIEIFRVPVIGGAETQVTANTIWDRLPIPGHDYVVYDSMSDPTEPGFIREYRYSDLASGSAYTIADRSPNHDLTFDGHRWVAFRNDTSLYKFDLLDPGAGPRLMAPYEMTTMGLAFDRDTGTLIAAAIISGESDNFRLESWDVATDTMTVLLDEPWSQVLCDVDGHVVVYEDSQAAGEPYGTRMLSELKIVDRDTGAKRVVMPLDTYYGVGIWERWIAFNNCGMYGDSLITCDLVAGGYLDADLHVIPRAIASKLV